MDTNQSQHVDDGDERIAGDLLVGADAIKSYLIYRGWPEDVDVYYLKRTRRWPIGKTSGDGGSLIASKRRLDRHVEKITRGASAA
jgi:hypothetical protein